MLENCKEKGNAYDKCKVESIRLRTLEADVQMLRRELEDANKQKAEAETQTESLQHALRHIKESNVKELEKKYEAEIKEMKHMVYLLTNHKKEVMRLRKEANNNGSERRMAQLEKECEVLHNDNYRLSQEIQYLEFKLKMMKDVTGTDGKEDMETKVREKMERNEVLALKLHYERRCKTLGELVLHWKEEAAAIYNKMLSSLDVLSKEHEKCKAESAEELSKLKQNYDKQISMANKQFIEVDYISQLNRK